MNLFDAYRRKEVTRCGLNSSPASTSTKIGFDPYLADDYFAIFYGNYLWILIVRFLYDIQGDQSYKPCFLIRRTYVLDELSAGNMFAKVYLMRRQ